MLRQQLAHLLIPGVTLYFFQNFFLIHSFHQEECATAGTCSDRFQIAQINASVYPVSVMVCRCFIWRTKPTFLPQNGSCFSSGEFIASRQPHCYDPLIQVPAGCWFVTWITVPFFCLGSYPFSLFRSDSLTYDDCKKNFPFTYPFIYWTWLSPAQSEVAFDLSCVIKMEVS